MCGLTAPGTCRVYYVCPHNPNNPRHAAKHPDHVRASFRDHVIYGGVDGILTGLLGHDRAAMMATHLPATQAAEDPSLIDELPYAPALLADAPAELRARIYAAFQVHALYRAEPDQATITATITDQTPGIIAALIADSRTDHDTADPERTNPPATAIKCFSYVIMLGATPALSGQGLGIQWLITGGRRVTTLRSG